MFVAKTNKKNEKNSKTPKNKIKTYQTNNHIK